MTFEMEQVGLRHTVTEVLVRAKARTSGSSCDYDGCQNVRRVLSVSHSVFVSYTCT